MKHLYKLFLLVFITSALSAQDSTFESIISTFSTSCASSTCHGTEANHPLKLAGSIDDIYNNLINVAPSNPAALDRGDKLVIPGDPSKSFLYRKVNGELYAFDQLHDQEGTNMPPYGTLTDVEKETVRQWILWGAPKDETVHNEDVLTNYYVDGNALDRIDPLPVPAEGEGFQIHIGTIFLEPNEEVEIMKLVEAPLGDSLEITGFEIRMNDFSHHYAVARAINGFENEINPGFTLVDNFFISFDFFNNSEFITGSQLPENIYHLPTDVAFRWDGSNALTFNYHIKNYSSTAVLPAEGYLNLYVQPRNIAPKEMRTATITYGDLNPFILQIEGGGEDTTFVMEHYEEGSEEVIDIWRLTPHTHAYGVDYDIFLRNADGSKGEQVYEGFYNYDLGFDQGFFDYSHATYRTFEDPLQIKMSEGLIFEATYNNPGEETVSFGQTTDDEMFIGYYLYTEADTTEIEEPVEGIEQINLLNANIFPNPVQNELFIEAKEIPNAWIYVYDIYGRIIKAQKTNVGNSKEKLNTESLATGTYFLQIRDAQNIYLSQKFLKQ